MMDALDAFKRTRDLDRKEILIMLTDGNPCLPWVCDWIKCGCGPTPDDRTGIEGGICGIVLSYYLGNPGGGGSVERIFIGIGNLYTTEYIGCLVRDRVNDIIRATDFQLGSLREIIPQLQQFTCPVTTGSPTSLVL